MERIAKLLKHNRLVFFLYRLVFGCFFRFIGLFMRIDNNLVLFVSYGGDFFNDSPRNLFEEMKKNDVFKNYKFVWALKKVENIDGASVVKIDTFKYFATALKAKVWITNVNIERGLRFKKKKTIYLNTWHGTGPKKGGRAIKGRNDYNFKNVDILPVDGEYSKINFIKYFNAVEKSMLWCGRPREDKLFDTSESQIALLKKKFDIGSDKKVIFYVPTWRDGKELFLNIEKFMSFLNENYVLIIRFHHFTRSRIENLNLKIIDATDYPDISDLYLISDYLISDYSSAFFDYGLLKRPYFSFAKDYDTYSLNPGLFIDMKSEFVGGIFTDEESLANRIVSGDYAKDSEECYKVCKKYVTVHQNATVSCVNRLIEIIQSREQKRL